MRKRLFRQSASKLIVAAVLLSAILLACTTPPEPEDSAARPLDGELRLISADGFGNPNNLDCGGRLIEGGGYIYAGTTNHVEGTIVYRSHDNGDTWEPISEPGIDGNPANAFTTTLVWFGGQLYVGTWQVDGAAMLFRANADATNAADIGWELIEDAGFDNPYNNGFTNGAVFDGYIYVGTFNLTQGSEVWRSSTGDPGSWEMCMEKGWGRNDNSDTTVMFVHQGYLYAATEMVRGSRGQWGGTTIFRTAGGPGELTWEQIAPNGYGNISNVNTGAMNVFRDQFYAATWNPRGMEVWRADMVGDTPWSWDQVYQIEPGHTSNQLCQGAVVLGDEILIGSMGDYFTTPGKGELHGSSDGETWTRITAAGFIEGGVAGIIWMYRTDDRVLISLYAKDGPGELWVYE